MLLQSVISLLVLLIVNVCKPTMIKAYMMSFLTRMRDYLAVENRESKHLTASLVG